MTRSDSGLLLISYTARSAWMISSLAARTAGRKPPINPISREWGLACLIDLFATQPGPLSLAREHLRHTFPQLTAFRRFGASGLRGIYKDESGALFKVQGSTKENSAGRLRKGVKSAFGFLSTLLQFSELFGEAPSLSLLAHHRPHPR